MKLIRHRLYRGEITGALWASAILNMLGACVLDGGVVGCIVLIGTLAYWCGTVRPMARKIEIKSDRQFMHYGLFMAIGLSVILSPAVWVLRGKF